MIDIFGGKFVTSFRLLRAKKLFFNEIVVLNLQKVSHKQTRMLTDQVTGPTPATVEGSPRKIQKIEVSNGQNSQPLMRFAKLSENALTPTRGSKQAAGFDLYSAYDYKVASRGKVLAKTDIQIALPDGCYGRIAPRSGLAHKHFIDVGAGVIDQDYRGNVGVILFNFGENEFEVKKGDRIAQLILERIFIPDLLELPTLDETDRGEGGFGSTGHN